MSSDEIVQVNFRMPAALKERLEDAAASNHRTVTAELVARLERSFMTAREITSADIAEEIQAIRQRLDRIDLGAPQKPPPSRKPDSSRG